MDHENHDASGAEGDNDLFDFHSSATDDTEVLRSSLVLDTSHLNTSDSEAGSVMGIVQGTGHKQDDPVSFSEERQFSRDDYAISENIQSSLSATIRVSEHQLQNSIQGRLDQSVITELDLSGFTSINSFPGTALAADEPLLRLDTGIAGEPATGNVFAPQVSDVNNLSDVAGQATEQQSNTEQSVVTQVGSQSSILENENPNDIADDAAVPPSNSGNSGSNTNNTPPNTNSDSGSSNEDSTLVLDVLANDSDPEGDSLSLSNVVIDSGLGSVSIVANQVVYDPGSDYNHLANGDSETVTT